MLRGRLFLRYYILIAYVSVSFGYVFARNLPDDQRIFLAVVLFVIGIIGHFAQHIGYYVSLVFNSLATGFLVPIIMNYFEFSVTPFEMGLSASILMVFYIGITYLASWKWKDNIGMPATYIIIPMVWLLLLGYLTSVDTHLYYSIFLMYHIGLLYIIALWVAGVQSEELLHHSSIASFALLIIALAVTILVLVAGALGGGASSSSKSSNKSSSSKRASYGPRRYSHSYYHHHYFYGDAYYFGQRRKRNDDYSQAAEQRAREEELEKKKQKEEQTKKSDKMTSKEDKITDGYVW
jgi:hypothetical protein